MVRPSKRRYCNVFHAKHLVESILYIRQQKQISNLDRIVRYMKREYDHSEYETEKQLQYAVKDNIISQYTQTGKKGSMTGVPQEGYRLPEEEDLSAQQDDHDWYCFECHTQGDVLSCSDCWRVFHPSCTTEEWTGPKFTCSICNEIEDGIKKNKMKRKMLNTLLSYTIARMKEKTRELHKIGHRETEVRYEKYFIYFPMDLNRIEQKVKEHKYRSLEEFLADTQLIYHNVYLMYGDEVKGGMTELAQIMSRDCKYDVEEIKQCQTCYYLSNAKPKEWFCEPCDPPHELVYARQKGYSYWPAKVIRREGDKYDVRFFGGYHQRAVLPKEQIKPITVNPKTLVVKRTAGFVKASEELKRHQIRLEEYKKEQEDVEDEEEDQSEHSKETESEKMEEDEEEVTPSGEDDEFTMNGNHESSPLEVSSTSISPPKKRACLKVSTTEDFNVVTSSEDRVNIPKITATVGIQTEKEKPKPTKSQHCQTDKVETSPPPTLEEPAPAPKEPINTLPQKTEPPPTLDPVPEKKPSEDKFSFEMDMLREELEEKNEKEIIKVKADLEAKHKNAIRDLKEEMEEEFREEKGKALSEQSERLKKDFEEDKQAAVSRAMANMRTETERVKRQTEEKCKGEYMEEMRKLAQKHKEAISATKKKQWCYNCEEEAMYHCCWNTSYCSVKCQQDHWHKEHKRVCRRKRS